MSERAAASMLHARTGFLLVFLFVVLGDFLGISQISPTINYNYLNSALLYIGFGLIFAYCADRGGRQFWLLLLAGAAIGFDFFVKFSSSIVILGCGTLFLLMLANGEPLRRRWRPVFLLGLGYLLGIALFFLFIMPFDTWLANFTHSLHAQTGGSHSPLRMLNKQVNDFKRIGIQLAQFYLLPLVVLFFLARKYLREAQSGWWVIVPLMLLLNALVAYQLYHLTNFRFYTLYEFATILILLVTLVATGAIRGFSGIREITFCLILLLFPFLLVLGSDSSFSYSAPLYLLPWFGFIFLLIRRLPTRPLRLATALTVIVLAEAQFVAGYLYFPWRWVENRLAQTEPVTARGLEGIRVDAPTHRFITESQRIMRQASPSSRKVMLALYEMPGLVYWLDGVSPGLPWFSHNKHEQAFICQQLRNAQGMDLPHAALLIQENISPTLSECLGTLGVRLENYRPIGTTHNPYSDEAVIFYAPREEAPHAQ